MCETLWRWSNVCCEIEGVEASEMGAGDSHPGINSCVCVQVREGLHYNPYFVGGAIAMPKMLADEGTEYDDGTPATESQQAKVRNLAKESEQHSCHLSRSISELLLV